MAWVSCKPLASGRYRAGYVTRDKERKTFVGTTKKSDTLKAAQQFEVEEREIRVKLRAAPGPEEQHANRPIGEVVTEYIRFGRSQGGRRNMSWARRYGRRREHLMNWWVAKLGLRVLGDVNNNILAAAQRAIQQDVQATGRTGKTCCEYRECLMAFCRWAIRMKYLAKNPLEGWPQYDMTPKMKRRCLTEQEIGALLSAAPDHRRLIYEVALATGLRANELRSLKIGNLDVEAGGLRLQAEWTKNRHEDFQPLPNSLLRKLVAASEDKPENAPLLKTSHHHDRNFTTDREKAGIPADKFGGRATFHSLRHTAITLAGDCGASAKEMQTFARHSDPRLTLNVYAKVRQGRQSEIAERIGNVIEDAKRSVDVSEQRAQSVHAKAAGAETCSPNNIKRRNLGDNNQWYRGPESNRRPWVYESHALTN